MGKLGGPLSNQQKPIAFQFSHGILRLRSFQAGHPNSKASARAGRVVGGTSRPILSAGKGTCGSWATCQLGVQVDKVSIPFRREPPAFCLPGFGPSLWHGCDLRPFQGTSHLSKTRKNKSPCSVFDRTASFSALRTAVTQTFSTRSHSFPAST